MTKKKNTNQYKNGITLKDLIKRGEVDEFYHLKEQRFVGGLTMPNKMNSWWKRNADFKT